MKLAFRVTELVSNRSSGCSMKLVSTTDTNGKYIEENSFLYNQTPIMIVSLESQNENIVDEFHCNDVVEFDLTLVQRGIPKIQRR